LTRIAAGLKQQNTGCENLVQGGLDMAKPHVMGKDALTKTPVTTSGITRHVAFQGNDFLVSRSLVAPGIVSGWHHHGAFDQYGYMVSGVARLEYGPGGRDAITLGTGDFWHMPANTIHRDVSPSAPEGQVAIIFYRGTGPMVVNVEGPEPA
jgi:quercetin dioxygenase-like cupin family protein